MSTFRQQSIDEINSLRLYPEFKIEKVDESLYRINDKFDLYPSTRRIYGVGDSKKHMGWRRGELLEKIRLVVKKGITCSSWDLIYIIGKSKPQYVLIGKPYSVCEQEKIKCLQSGQYRQGTLRLIRNLK